MPLIRRDSPEQTAALALEPLDRLAADLRDPDPERRWSAARRMGGRPGAMHFLVSGLIAARGPRLAP